MIDTTIVVKPREVTGTSPNRRLRKQGIIPAVVYGSGLDSMALEVKERTVRTLLRQAGENAVFLLQLEGGQQTRNAMIRDIQFEPHTDRLIHIDFQRVRMDQVVQVSVPIELEGVPVGVKDDGGILDFITREIEVECLPDRIPHSLTISVAAMHIGEHLETKDLVLPEGVIFVDHEERVIASVNRPRLEEVEEEETEEELIEGEAARPKRVGHEDDEDDDA